jgi:hypothetical protein
MNPLHFMLSVINSALVPPHGSSHFSIFPHPGDCFVLLDQLGVLAMTIGGFGKGGENLV